MLEKIFLHQKAFSQNLRTAPLSERRRHLNNLEKMISENIEKIISALQEDFQKPAAETLLTEIYPLIEEIKEAKKNLKRWTRPTSVGAPLFLRGTKNRILREPRGVCLLIAPWNYPFQLAIAPLIGAIAAGNCVILKPSEITRHTSSLLATLVPQYFNKEHIAVVEGGAETTQELLKFSFDHIFFTGSTRVGKIIMQAASQHLTPVTLELGGKSPTIVDETCNLKIAAQRIVWGKFLNAGQTCIAPDYVLIADSVYEKFKNHLIEALQEFYGKTSLERKQSPSFARIISTQAANRQHMLLSEALEQGATLVYGGECLPEERYIEPTLLENVSLECDLMKEEIFGPLLPLRPYKDLNEVIHFINERPRPLALYIFSKSRLTQDRLQKEVPSGGLAINNTLVHVANSQLPFGGLKESGLGSYHGYYGFRTFSHERALLKQPWGNRMMSLVYAPYRAKTLQLLRFMIRWKI